MTRLSTKRLEGLGDLVLMGGSKDWDFATWNKTWHLC